jgi:hypothetical protein
VESVKLAGAVTFFPQIYKPLVQAGHQRHGVVEQYFTVRHGLLSASDQSLTTQTVHLTPGWQSAVQAQALRQLAV